MNTVTGQTGPGGGKHVAVIGLGLIGSALTGELVRMPAVGRVTTVDPDVYEERNRRSQQITEDDVGQPKAIAQARRITQIAPWIETEAIVDRVENVPPARLRCDVIAACLDSKAARRDVNALAWHLGVPWIDAGVNAAAGMLARVNVYVPSATAACHECAWDDRAYETLGVRYRCGGGPATAPTNSPAWLGSLAAAIQAAELAKLLAGDVEHLAVGKSIVVSTRYHTLDVTQIQPRPDTCRFDHEIWRTDALSKRPGDMTFGQVLDHAGGATSLAVEGRPFVRTAECEQCRQRSDADYFAAPDGSESPRACACGGQMFAVGSAMTEAAEAPDLSRLQPAPLDRAGIVDGDVIRLTDEAGRTKRLEVRCDRTWKRMKSTVSSERQPLVAATVGPGEPCDTAPGQSA